MNDFFTFFLFAIALLVLYRFVIPFFFPSVIQGVSLVKAKGESEVYAFQGGKVPLIQTQKRSHVKALRRRQQNVYNTAKV